MVERVNEKENGLKLVKKQISVFDQKVVETNEYLSGFKVDPKKVYCFLLSGSLCTDKKIAGAFIEVVDSMLGRKKDPSLVGSYGDVEMLAVQYDEGGDLTEKQVDEFSNILMKFVTKDGERVNINDAVKGINKVSFFTFCRGSKNLVDVGESFCSKLVDAGYSKNEINSIINGTLSVSYAPESISHVFPDIRLHSFADQMLGERYVTDYRKIAGKTQKLNGVDVVYCCDSSEDLANIKFLKNLTESEKNNIDKVKKYKREKASSGFVKNWDENSICVYTNKAINTSRAEINDHGLSKFGRNASWDIIPYKVEGLFKKVHTHQAPVADFFSLAMANTLGRNIAFGFDVVRESLLPERPSMIEIAGGLEDLSTVYSKEDYCEKGFFK